MNWENVPDVVAPYYWSILKPIGKASYSNCVITAGQQREMRMIGIERNTVWIYIYAKGVVVEFAKLVWEWISIWRHCLVCKAKQPHKVAKRHKHHICYFYVTNLWHKLVI